MHTHTYTHTDTGTSTHTHTLTHAHAHTLHTHVRAHTHITTDGSNLSSSSSSCSSSGSRNSSGSSCSSSRSCSCGEVSATFMQMSELRLQSEQPVSAATAACQKYGLQLRPNSGGPTWCWPLQAGYACAADHWMRFICAFLMVCVCMCLVSLIVLAALMLAWPSLFNCLHVFAHLNVGLPLAGYVASAFLSLRTWCSPLFVHDVVYLLPSPCTAV